MGGGVGRPDRVETHQGGAAGDGDGGERGGPRRKI